MIYWIFCDIDSADGAGRCWRLAIGRGDKLYFPVEGFEEEQEFFKNYPSVELCEPPVIPEIRCTICKMKHVADESNIQWRDGMPFCHACWTNVDQCVACGEYYLFQSTLADEQPRICKSCAELANLHWNQGE